MFKVRFDNDEEIDTWTYEEVGTARRAALNFLDYIFYEVEGHSWMCKYDTKPKVRVEDTEGNVHLFTWDVELIPSFALYGAGP